MTPLSYEMHSNLSERSIKIGTSERKRLSENERDVPGVGSYTLNQQKDWKASVKVKFGKARRSGRKSVESLPGRNNPLLMKLDPTTQKVSFVVKLTDL